MTTSSLHVTSTDRYGRRESFVFTSTFTVGRSPTNDITIEDRHVDPRHVEVVRHYNDWYINDLDSRHGTLVNKEAILQQQLKNEAIIQLGHNGPTLTVRRVPQHIQEEIQAEIQPDKISRTPAAEPVEPPHFHYPQQEPAQSRTRRHMRSLAMLFRSRSRRFRSAMTLVAILLSLVTSLLFFSSYFKVQHKESQAIETFYAIKSLELKNARHLKSARENNDHLSRYRVKTYRKKKQKLDKKYSQIIDELGIYQQYPALEDRLILKVARSFGESEIFVTPDFIAEVHRYIKKWQATNRFSQAVTKAQRKGYSEKIAATLQHHDLPPLFFYLALQESDFNIYAAGPKTRWGIAKGMWQFIPATAREMGLKTGPLVKSRRADPQDERQHFAKSTQAAARLLRRIYDSDAQGSGLLVMMSYNWGQHRLGNLMAAAPKHPKNRNFWSFLADHRGKIPQETYDYVFYIFAAAVIGENPPLFGFKLQNPLLLAQNHRPSSMPSL